MSRRTPTSREVLWHLVALVMFTTGVAAWILAAAPASVR